MGTFVSLGGFVFQDFEIPQQLNFGGHQKILEHNLIGGQRLLNAMGPTPFPIGWQGRFRGPNALSRAYALDAMRQSGAQVPLVWGSLYRLVVICAFAAKPMKAWEVPYEIECRVVLDPTTAGAGFVGALASTLDGLVGGDMTSVASSFGGVSLGF